jgi:DNA repair protein RecN (Recombination protein N)
MLVELMVENYAVIEQVRVRFHRGLNLLTGETGSGKSMIVDALGLLLGARTSAGMVRAGAERARIAGIFEVAPTPAMLSTLEEAGIETEDHELLIEREIMIGGKSRAFVGNRPATVALLKELGAHLADIHGQHDQQQLFSSDTQQDLLDAFAGTEERLEETASLYQRWRACAAALEELDRSAQENLRLADLYEHQRREIESVAPGSAEDAQLEHERRILRNVVQLEQTATAAYAALYDSPDSVSAQLRIVLRRLEELERIDDTIAEVLGSLRPAAIAVDEAAHSLLHYVGKLEADPSRLDAVEARLAALEKLKRKYGGKMDEVLAFLEDVRGKLASVENSAARGDALRKELEELSGAYRTSAAKLTANRTDAARRLAKRVEIELAALAMEKTRVEIRVEPAPWSGHGADSVEILLAPNVGEDLKPLETIASGGELSRIALALKTCATPARPLKNTIPHTLVFDEVDAGVGGGAAEAVGRRLKRLAASNQVLCVTHLPQIAGFADHHYYVEKRAVGRRTLASIAELTAAERTREIGRMLSGERVTPEALRHAEQLLKFAAE